MPSDVHLNGHIFSTTNAPSTNMSKRQITSFFAPVASKKQRFDLTSKLPPSTHPNYPHPITCLPPALVFSSRQGADVNDGGSSSNTAATDEIAPLVFNGKPDLDMLHYQPFLHRSLAQELYTFLRRELPFYRVTYSIKRDGTDTVVNTPRYTSLFGVDAMCIFHPETGTLLDAEKKLPIKYAYPGCNPRPIPQCLLPLLEYTEARTNSSYNFLLINYYSNGADSIAFHSDDESFLGENPTIASLTLGSTRDFVMKHKTEPSQKLSLPLASGDLVLMKGTTQPRWLHSVPKRKHSGPRINITFRFVKTRKGTENYYRYNVGTGPVYRWDEATGEMKVWERGKEEAVSEVDASVKKET